jgi:Tat protein translocase TatB subunit
MFGTLGGPELFLIFVVALIVFGPRKLPEIGKSLGKMMAEFRKASNEFRSTIESEVEAEKIRDALRIEPPRYGGPVAAAPAAPPETKATPEAPGAQPEAAAAGGEPTAATSAATAPDPQAADSAVAATVSRQPQASEPAPAVQPIEPR